METASLHRTEDGSYEWSGEIELDCDMEDHPTTEPDEILRLS